MVELLGLPYSPWTEKARWALDARGVSYTFRVYQPLVGEPALRSKLRRFTGPVSVPVLTTDDGQVIAGSASIARWADARGKGPSLFPVAHEAAVVRYSELSERALEAGRGLSLRRMLDDDEALAEMVPRPLRRSLGRLASRLGAMGVRRTLRKYGGHRVPVEAQRQALAAALDELRAGLRAAPPATPRTLLGGLTYADIAMAQALLFVEPPAAGIKLGKASRRAFTDPELRASCDDLLRWRDELYQSLR
jgi:glutathione S-transferase